MSFTYAYPHMAVTADAVVFDDATPMRVLLIQRARAPFRDNWALPGGFVDMDETIEAAAHRELMEETGVSGVSLSFLGDFDAIGRDPRERTLGMAFVGVVTRAVEIRASDDAASVKWHPVDDLPVLAFDHAEIIRIAIARQTGSV